MQLSQLFENDVARDIPPVVYFHDQKPQRLKDEVGEYIITGGYPKDDTRSKRVPHGIHEAYVKLIREITRRLVNKQSLELPACWISGFYGSGKSSFAKLLGLSLDGRKLPDGALLADAWLRRDTSPLSPEFAAAWKGLNDAIKPISVVFDIGGEARDNEQIHAAAVRQVQKRLGYSKFRLIADYELGLERDGHIADFLAKALEVHGKPWPEIKNRELADDLFSEVLHHLWPQRFKDPLSWVDSRAGSKNAGMSASEAVHAIGDMLDRHEPGATLFLVVDEVSQYIFRSNERMLALQSFVSSLGQRLGGRVWLMVTGQEKLDAQNAETVIGKMKDRFPESLRVHLGALNIRDVVHKRLLKKKKKHEQGLRDLFQKHRSSLKLYAHDCEHITEEDFVEVYPMLPGHIELLLQITSALRSQVSRAQGDNHAIRGLLQLLGELFRTKGLADAELGKLITLDDIYEIQGTALSGAAQTTMARILKWGADNSDDLSIRAAKAVALLQLIQDQSPTTEDFVAKCMYDQLDRGDNVRDVREALERLRAASLLSYSEKSGYKLQSGVGQEWDTERDKHTPTLDKLSDLVQAKLRHSVAPSTNPRLMGTPFKIQTWLSDGRRITDKVFHSYRNDLTFGLDLRYVGASAGDRAAWIRRSDEERLRDRLIWVVGPTGPVEAAARALARSDYMVKRYEPQRASLLDDRQSLLQQEQRRQQDLNAELARRVEAAFHQGTMYFRGNEYTPSDIGTSFARVLVDAANKFLPALYPHFVPTKVTKSELEQLLKKDLSGVSEKFLSRQLGILTLDAGRYEATCDGPVPARLLQYIEESGGTAGSVFFTHFSRPPYGFSAQVIRACVAGLVRGSKIRIRPESNMIITSLNDPNVQEIFGGDVGLRRADLLPPIVGPDVVDRKDRVAICRFFKNRLHVDINRDNDSIADAVFDHFPGQSGRLRDLLTRLNQLPGHFPAPTAIDKLGKALDRTQSSRQIEPTVKAVKADLDILNDGIQQLEIWLGTLNDDALKAVNDLSAIAQYQIPQLKAASRLSGEAAAAATRVAAQLEATRPWDGASALSGDVETLRKSYSEARAAIRTEQVTAEEMVREKFRAHERWHELDTDQVYRVLEPLGQPSDAMDLDAIQPTLVAMRDQAHVALQAAEPEARDRLDEILNPLTPTVKVKTGLSNREVGTMEELDHMLKELRDKVAPEIQAGRKVRLQ